jgi:hypothetical protein
MERHGQRRTIGWGKPVGDPGDLRPGLSRRAFLEVAAGLAALASDYARLEAAHLLVTLAIERHRSRYQDPLISRASHLFAALTGQSFACLALDYRDDVLTLATARADGRCVPIACFSTIGPARRKKQVAEDVPAGELAHRPTFFGKSHQPSERNT